MGDLIPKPFAEWPGFGVLYCADCTDVLPHLEGAAIVTDPPYGISFVKGSSGGQGAYRGSCGDARLSRGTEAVKGDNRPFDPAPLLRFENALMWGANHYCHRLPEGKGRWLAWNKLEYLESFDSFSDVEFAWHSKGKASRVCNFMWKGGLACRKGGEDNGRRDHPTQKPVGVMEWCIEQAGLSPGDVVIDPFAGVGTTAVACIRRGMRFILCEIVPGYCLTARDRIDRELSQPKLPFVSTPVEKQAELFGSE